MAEPEQVAVLVVLRAGTSETEASMLRSAMRLWPQVVDVRPVSKDNRQSIAESRARGQVTEELSPIFDQLRAEVTNSLDAATDSFLAITGEPTVDPVRVAEQHRPSRTVQLDPRPPKQDQQYYGDRDPDGPGRPPQQRSAAVPARNGQSDGEL